LDPKRPHRPAEVVAVRHEVRRTVVHPLAPREAVRLALLAAVLPAVRRVVPLHERRVDGVAHPRPPHPHLHQAPHPQHYPLPPPRTPRARPPPPPPPSAPPSAPGPPPTPAGSSLRGEGVRPGPGLRCGCTHSP